MVILEIMGFESGVADKAIEKGKRKLEIKSAMARAEVFFKEEGDWIWFLTGHNDSSRGEVLPDLYGVDINARGDKSAAIVASIPRQSAVIIRIKGQIGNLRTIDVEDRRFHGNSQQAVTGTELEKNLVVKQVSIGSYNPRCYFFQLQPT